MTESTLPGARGRRAAPDASRRPSPLTVLAVLIPLLTIGALSLVRPAEEPVAARPPTDADLTRTTLVCPAALPGTTEVVVGHADPGARGRVATRIGQDGDVRLAGGRATTTSQDPLVVVAEGDLAPGLLAGRGGDGSATACGEPQPDQWFTGLSAGAEHSSELTLVNPDRGSAVADITVLGPTGPVEVPQLRGVTVPGGEAATYDLADVAPSRDVLALRVQVTRGRLGAHVVDRVDELGEGARSADWLPRQGAPATTSYLLGLGEGEGDRTLTVANPGDDEARVGLRLVTERSELAPADVEEVRVRPGATEVVDLGELLAAPAAKGTVGLRLESSVPVTASLRSFVADDVSYATTGAVVEQRAAAVVPRGAKRLVLGGADALGVATVVTRDGKKAPERRRVEVGPGKGAVVDLPDAATYVEIRLARTSAVASVEVAADGLAVLPLAELVLTGRVPDVIPALG